MPWLPLSHSLGSCAPSLVRADEPKLRLSTFIEEITPPLGHPCMGGGIAAAKEIVDPLFAQRVSSCMVRVRPLRLLRSIGARFGTVALRSVSEKIAKAIDTDPVRVDALLAPPARHPDCRSRSSTTPRKNIRLRELFATSRFWEKTVRSVAASAKESLKLTKPVTHIGTGDAKVEKVASNRTLCG